MNRQPINPTTATDVEVLSPAAAIAADLSTAASVINQALDTIVAHEETFEGATLEHRLEIGRQILLAKEAFGLSIPNPKGINQHTKEVMPRRGTTSAEDPEPLLTPAEMDRRAAGNLGLSAWLKREIPRLPRGTADKYSTAFNALGLEPSAATPAAIRERVKKLRHEAGRDKAPMPTLGSLYRAARPTGPLRIQAPETPPQTRLEDARQFFWEWQEKGEQLIKDGHLEDLDKPGLERLRDFYLWLRDRVSARLKDI